MAPDRPSEDSRAAHVNTPWAMVDDAASARRVNTVRRTSLHPGIVGGGQPGQLGQVPGQAERPLGVLGCPAPGVRCRAGVRGRPRPGAVGGQEGQGPVGQPAGPSGQLGELGASARSGAGLSVAGLPSHHPP